LNNGGWKEKGIVMKGVKLTKVCSQQDTSRNPFEHLTLQPIIKDRTVK
jgi:hypothetical protein